MAAAAKAGAAVSCSVVVLFVLIQFICKSIKTVDQMESCLKYNWIMNTVDDVPVSTAGMHWVGIENTLVCYPNFNQYVYFRNYISGDPAAIYRPPVHVRTSDGLAVNISMEFVYRLPPAILKNVYMLTAEARVDDYDDDRRTDDGYTSVMMNVAEGALDNKATEYPAMEFYENRIGVQTEFFNAVSVALRDSLGIEVVALQLQPATFPTAYANSIVETQVMFQDQLVAVQEQASQRVQRQTDLQLAQQLANRARIEAEAEAERIRFDNQARIEQFSYRQRQDARGYAHSLEFFGDQASFITYLGVRAMTEHTDGMLSTHLHNV